VDDLTQAIDATSRTDWLGIAALVTAIGGLFKTFYDRHTAKRDNKLCKQELLLMRRKYRHLERAQRLTNDIVSRLIPDDMMFSIQRGLEKLRNKMDQEDIDEGIEAEDDVL
jgi:hypothetical protein